MQCKFKICHTKPRKTNSTRGEGKILLKKTLCVCVCYPPYCHLDYLCLDSSELTQNMGTLIKEGDKFAKTKNIGYINAEEKNKVIQTEGEQLNMKN